MGNITTHVLDAARGRPAAGVPVVLERRTGDAWQPLADGLTDHDGRCGDLTPGPLGSGVHRLVFDTSAYFAASNQRTFYPEVAVTFDVADVDQHYHVPLLLSPFSYTTYRGS